MIRVTIWNEYLHETRAGIVKDLYPRGMHEALREALECDEFEITTAYLEQDEEHGLSKELLDNTDVLLWWGHTAHDRVRDDVAARVVSRVLNGMGFIPLHSAHYSKPFRKLMGTPCTLRWRNADERAHVWTVAPEHPIARDVPMHFELAGEEMYGEFFQIPKPDDIVFITWFKGGNVFRGGCTFARGQGKIFYFHPGHETCPSYYNPHVIKAIANAIHWARPTDRKDYGRGDYEHPIEPF